MLSSDNWKVIALLCLIGVICFFAYYGNRMDPAEEREREESRIATARGAKPPFQPRKVILFNDASTVVTVFKDVEAIQASIEFMATESSRAKAIMNAAEVDGRSFQVRNGTRATVVGESAELVKIKELRLYRIEIGTGPHAGESAYCFSTVTQPE